MPSLRLPLSAWSSRSRQHRVRSSGVVPGLAAHRRSSRVGAALGCPGLLPGLRSGLLLGFLLGLFVGAFPATAQPSGLGLEPVASGLASPTALAHAGDGRLFIAERSGRVRVLNAGGLASDTFLDLEERVGSGGERGLLGLAFHPRYASNGFVFAHYTDRQGNTVLSRFRVAPGQPDGVQVDSERVLLRVSQPFPNHNGGALAFGPDGYLYVALGDGGNAFDPLCRALDRSSLLGKVLRLDVDRGASVPPYHSIPDSNPYAGSGGARPEIWAYGLRNPWRISFDRSSGDLYIADVGQNTREELNVQPFGAAGGESYGWKVLEGTHCLGDVSGCPGRPPGCGAAIHLPPVLEYGHTGGRCSVTGGFVYRGSRIPSLNGWYVFGDFCSGEIFATQRESGWALEATGLEVPRLTTFGEGADGELYATGLDGVLYRLSGPTLEPSNCAADTRTLCLGEADRFQVRANFRVGEEAAGEARVESITGDTGYLWFFRATNVEAVVKVLDGCPVNGRFWVFAGGLTDVEVELVVTDTATGRQRRYVNRAGRPFAPIQDTAAFATCS